MPVAVKPQGGLGPAITGLVLGIIGIPLNFIPFLNLIVGLPVSVIGLIFSIVGMRRINGRGIAIAGLVLCIIGLLIVGVEVLIVGALLSSAH